MKNKDIFLSDLSSSFENSVLWEEDKTKIYQTDYKTGFSGKPIAVFFPQTSEEIKEGVRLCLSHKIPMVPRGAGTGRSGGAVPAHGALVISLEKMNQTVCFEPESCFVEVEAGKILSELHKEVESQHLFYPPDPASLYISTLGGNVAENAGGPRAFKYGVTKDYITGLEVILPHGEIVQTGVYTRKGVAGYDLTSQFIGSEGTLGIISKIRCKLIPKPMHTQTILLQFLSISHATQAVSFLVQKGFFPATMELMDEYALCCLRKKEVTWLEEKAKSALILELDGTIEFILSETKRLKSWLSSLNTVDFFVAEKAEDACQIWSLRRGLSDALRELYRFKLSEDVVVPLAKMAFFAEKAKEIASQTPVHIAMYGHAGDGNFHVNFLWNEEVHAKNAFALVEEIFEWVWKCKGTITGEHGIGLTKRNYLQKEIGLLQWELQRKTKELYDPFYLFNPGKIFPVPSSFPQPLFDRNPLEALPLL